MKKKNYEGFEKELETAKKLAIEAGKMLLSNQGSKLEIKIKEDNSPVTNIDKAVSVFLRKSFSESFPDYGILDEETELNGEERKNEYCWIIDPLDGTISYINGDVSYGVLIGLIKNGKPVLGVAYKPKSDELCYAVEKQGSYIEIQKEIKKLSVSESDRLEILVSGHRKNAELDEILEKIKNSDYGNYSLSCMYSSFKTIEVARGNANLFLSPCSVILNLWDLCAPQIILQEAGGVITDIYGNAFDYFGDSQNKNGVIASNKIVYNKILKILNQENETKIK